MKNVVWFAGKLASGTNKWGEQNGKFFTTPNLERGFFLSLSDAEAATAPGAKPVAVVQADIE